MQLTLDTTEMGKYNSQIMIEAFFKYVKDVSKNKTPVTMELTRTADCWEANLFECATPASSFGPIYLSAKGDHTEVGSTEYLAFNARTINTVSPGTTYSIVDGNLLIKSNGVKVKDAYDSTSDEVKVTLDQFLEILSPIESEINLEITKGTDIYRFLQVVGKSETAAIYISDGKLTLRDGSFFFRTNFDYDKEPLFINMYLANKILNILEYTDRVTCQVSNTFRIEGFVEGSTDPIAINVSTVYDPVEENPTDEDLLGITPGDDATSVEVALAELVNTFAAAKDKIKTFIESSSDEVALMQNGTGLSLMCSTPVGSATTSKVTINIGDVEVEEPDETDFTEYKVFLPLDAIYLIVGGNDTVRLNWDDNDDNAVSISSDKYIMLTGKNFV